MLAGKIWRVEDLGVQGKQWHSHMGGTSMALSWDRPTYATAAEPCFGGDDWIAHTHGLCLTDVFAAGRGPFPKYTHSNNVIFMLFAWHGSCMCVGGGGG